MLRFTGRGLFAAKDITFRQEGELVADVVVVEGGKVEFVRCRFTGEVPAGKQREGIGLKLQEGTTGEVRDCMAEGNSIGILQAETTLERNVLRNNTVAGIYYDGGGGKALQNECSENQYGIHVDGSPPDVSSRDTGDLKHVQVIAEIELRNVEALHSRDSYLGHELAGWGHLHGNLDGHRGATGAGQRGSQNQAQHHAEHDSPSPTTHPVLASQPRHHAQLNRSISPGSSAPAW